VPLNCLPQRLYADAGYDADWIDEMCRGEWGIESVIKPARCRADGSLGGEHQSAMTSEYLKKQGYGKRWHIESFLSSLNFSKREPSNRSMAFILPSACSPSAILKDGIKVLQTRSPSHAARLATVFSNNNRTLQKMPDRQHNAPEGALPVFQSAIFETVPPSSKPC